MTELEISLQNHAIVPFDWRDKPSEAASMLDGAASSFIFKSEPGQIIETIDKKHGSGERTREKVDHPDRMTLSVPVL